MSVDHFQDIIAGAKRSLNPMLLNDIRVYLTETRHGKHDFTNYMFQVRCMLVLCDVKLYMLPINADIER